ncbi:hypothetical protein PhCBS80983_g06147 [Powellomyces hirtus]|uniref:Acyltransferase 3 domain-containing protein n=1 Tax=Powellomyces hirtus TaxID=109895 RepID=A0A507DQW6_9FUNG|nr:hypothetical protein PhCBS80983_g06147 [Powellomyces hirtus]
MAVVPPSPAVADNDEAPKVFPLSSHTPARLSPISVIDIERGIMLPSPPPTTPKTTSLEERTAVATTQKTKSLSAPTAKLDYLEGLRGIAAWIVVTHHFAYENLLFKDTVADWGEFIGYFANLFVHGKFAVSLFFVLSGRVLGIGYLKSPSAQRLASAFLRRPFRLIIPVIGALWVHWFMYRVGAYEPAGTAASYWGNWLGVRYSIDRIKENPPSFIGQFLLGLTTFLPRGKLPAFPNDPTWTLGLELQGSFVVFVLSLVAKSYHHHRYIIQVLFILWSFWTQSWNVSFATGLLLADLAHSGYFARIRKASWWIHYPLRIILAFIFIVTVCYFPVISPEIAAYSVRWSLDLGNAKIGMLPGWNWDMWDPLTYFAAFALLTLMEITPSMQRVFQIPPIRFLGKVSFGLYLLHMTVYATFGSIMIIALYNPNAAIMPEWLKLTIVYFTTLAVMIALSYVFHLTFDNWSMTAGFSMHQLLSDPDWSRAKVRTYAIALLKRNSPRAWMRRVRNKMRPMFNFRRRKQHQEQTPLSPGGQLDVEPIDIHIPSRQ